MRISRISSIIVLSAVAVWAAPLYAQQAADDAKSTQAAQSAAQPAAASDTSASESAEAAATAAMIAKANAAAAAAAAKAPAPKPPADAATLAKRAKQSGWMPESRNGETVYCRNVPEVGSRFNTKRCVSDVQVAEILERSEFDKDQLSQRGCSGNCGGK